MIGTAPPQIMTTRCFWWTDGIGLRRRNTDDLVFDSVRPRVDVCTCQAAKGRPLRLARAPPGRPTPRRAAPRRAPPRCTPPHRSARGRPTTHIVTHIGAAQHRGGIAPHAIPNKSVPGYDEY